MVNERISDPVVAARSSATYGSQCWNQGWYGLDAILDAADRAISAEVFV
ncbi:MAG TPA: hypothetical protein VK845_08740 [Gemmatimonadales bacterium]|nr:hypothetical protein [Gemmatimonadales bacterium]